MREHYIGLMSGTTADGINAVVVDFSDEQPTLIAKRYTPFSALLKQSILEIMQPGHDEINRLGKLDVVLGNAFADAVLELLRENNLSPEVIRAIGSHGQTVRHHPNLGFTLQIADPNIIAAKTGITTIADFRRRDMALGGQGAPLVPRFHQTVFASQNNDRAIVNIGGVANITFLPCDNRKTLLGFDTGPGNNLMDAWIKTHRQQEYDNHGAWAASGTISAPLLNRLLQDAYFQLPPPKSTGPEYFNLTWLEQYISPDISTMDVAATLAELTACTITTAIKKLMTQGEILICGGGAHNHYLMQRLSVLAKPLLVASTESYGIHPDWMEAMAFAWLAKQTIAQKSGNSMHVTGASKEAILGGVYYQ